MNLFRAVVVLAILELEANFAWRSRISSISLSNVDSLSSINIATHVHHSVPHTPRFTRPT
jgi:hypothetical protein